MTGVQTCALPIYLAHALLEHGDRRIGEARIDEALVFALEARLRRFHFRIDEALREKERLGRLAELRAQLAPVDEGGGRAEFAGCNHRIDANALPVCAGRTDRRFH